MNIGSDAEKRTPFPEPSVNSAHLTPLLKPLSCGLT